MSWEDPALDRQVFARPPGHRIATVASGGCNALTFLLDDPESVLAFDYNPTQASRERPASTQCPPASSPQSWRRRWSRRQPRR